MLQISPLFAFLLSRKWFPPAYKPPVAHSRSVACTQKLATVATSFPAIKTTFGLLIPTKTVLHVGNESHITTFFLRPNNLKQ
jgi:hypothetical protein